MVVSLGYEGIYQEAGRSLNTSRHPPFRYDLEFFVSYIAMYPFAVAAGGLSHKCVYVCTVVSDGDGGGDFNGGIEREMRLTHWWGDFAF